ncbi:MAG: TrkH family potassium uptake protein [Clostridiales bacterium]|nr:TrkH family potassium uptake protein [Clostridiales bacterium]
MNLKMVVFILGYIMRLEGALLLLPLVVAIYYKDATIASFLITMLLLFLIGYILSFKKPKNQIIYAKEGLVIVALSWIVLSLFGALPYALSGEIPNYIDAVFESVSGFSTTGASVVTRVEGLSNSLLFWRSFTQWIGGMGVLVFILAIAPLAGGRSMYIMKAEVPGPTVDKLVPKIQKSAKILYQIYIGMTILLTLLLLFGGMPIFDSLLHAFATAGTGGFGIKSTSVAHYNHAYTDVVITIFMVLFGVNFNLYYLIFTGSIITALKSEELRNYLAIIGCSALLVTINLMPRYENFFQSLRYALFQVTAIITTTGFANADFNKWPTFSKGILFFLMFVGACSGSTGGGIKVSRLSIALKSIVQYMRRMIHPRYVGTVRFEKKPVSIDTLKGVHIYISVYFFIYLISILLVSVDNYDFETTISAVTSCFNTVAPGFGMVGPSGNFSQFSGFSKLVLSMNMLLGRLEIFPIIMLFSPSLWKKGRHHSS